MLNRDKFTDFTYVIRASSFIDRKISAKLAIEKKDLVTDFHDIYRIAFRFPKEVVDELIQGKTKTVKNFNDILAETRMQALQRGTAPQKKRWWQFLI